MERNSQTENLKEYDITFCPPEEEMKNLTENLVVVGHSDLVKGLLCNSCKKLLYDPVSCTECQDLFCRVCISKINEKRSSNSNLCAHSSHINVDKTLKNILNKISLKCPRSSHGCEKILNYEALEIHLKTCAKSLYRCKFCYFRGSIEECLIHDQTCEPSLSTCFMCKDKIKTRKIDDHTQEVCMISISNYICFLKF
jgi:hypothetical protein